MASETFKDWLRSIRIRMFHWEYWPAWIVNFPLSFYYIYLCIKARSPFFFSASNPTIETGGMFFESKWKIFELIPKQYFPATIFIEEDDGIDQILSKMQFAKISFPIIAKPDRGEMGWGVRKITTIEELAKYRSYAAIEFLIQTYVPDPMEFSVFYYRHPKQEKGMITSLTYKELLTVTGDGSATLDQLIRQYDRAFLQYKKLKQNTGIDLNRIPEKDEVVNLVPYGNHVLGAKFLDYNHLIDAEITATFDCISCSIDGFYFGRFDLRCDSISNLKAGINISILELNGAGAQPAHIYQPGFSFFRAQHVMASYFRMMYEVSVYNHQQGVAYMTLAEYRLQKRKEKAFKQRMMVQ